MEEMEFPLFGLCQAREAHHLSNTEKPIQANRERALTLCRQEALQNLSSDTKTNWQREISEMVKNYKTKQESGSISYLTGDW
jgi:hypothetical protein